MRETAWFLTDAKDNAAIAAAKGASAGQKHVVTGIYAGFSNAATAGSAEITVDGATVISLRFTGQIALNNLELDLPSSVGKPVGIKLNASGGAGVFGTVLLNGYTK